MRAFAREAIPTPSELLQQSKELLIFYFNGQELNIKKEKRSELSSLWVYGSGPMPLLIVSSQFLIDLYDRLSL